MNSYDHPADSGVTPAQPQQVRCPRCGHQQPPDRHCHRCGVRFDRWKGLDSLLGDILDTDLGKDINAKWMQLCSNFENEAAHDEFLALCSENGLLDIAASLYRHYLLEHPDSVAARSRQERILFLVQQGLAGVEKLQVERQKKIGRIVTVAIALIMTAALGAATWWVVTNLPKNFIH